MNNSHVNGKWNEIKGEVKKMWGNLTDDELTKTEGDMNAIGGLIQQRYGDQKDTYKEKLNGIFERFADKKDAAMENTKNSLKN